jgi:hypothetical protein
MHQKYVRRIILNIHSYTKMFICCKYDALEDVDAWWEAIEITMTALFWNWFSSEY